MSLPGETTTEWCAGLQLVGTGPLDSASREALLREVQSYRLRSYKVFAL